MSPADQYYYGTVYEADRYAEAKISFLAWSGATEIQKKAALIEATNIIDALCFMGAKTDTAQSLQFPRGGDTEIPEKILWATYEIAEKLLDEITVDALLASARVTSNQYESVSTSYDARYTPEHVLVGIPSPIAWRWIKPYLTDPRDISLRRIS